MSETAVPPAPPSTPPSTPPPAPPPAQPPGGVPRARPYLTLLWLVPSLTLLAVGWWRYTDFEPGGTVDRIKLTTKTGPVGQAAEALRLITGTYDVFLRVKTGQGQFATPVKENTAIGNGLKWGLDESYKLQDLKQIDVIDKHTFKSDKQLDHINIDGQWSAEGQTFRVELIGSE